MPGSKFLLMATTPLRGLPENTKSYQKEVLRKQPYCAKYIQLAIVVRIYLTKAFSKAYMSSNKITRSALSAPKKTGRDHLSLVYSRHAPDEAEEARMRNPGHSGDQPLQFRYIKSPDLFGKLTFYQVFEPYPEMDVAIHAFYANGIRRLYDLQGATLSRMFRGSNLTFVEQRHVVDMLSVVRVFETGERLS